MELTIEQALQQGIAAHKEGKLQDAERLYRAILQSQPTHADANHNLGVLAVSVNKADAALPLFKTAFEANPKIEQFWLSYIDALIKTEKVDDARRVLSDAQQAGVTAAKLQIFEEQLEFELSPRSHIPQQEISNPLHSHQGELSAAIEFREIGRYKEAQEWLGNVIEHDSKNTEALSLLSQVLLLDKKEAEAEKVLTAAASINSELPSVYRNQARLLLKQSKTAEALEKAQLGCRQSPEDSESLLVLAACLGANQRDLEALPIIEKILKAKSNYAEAYANRALIRLRAKDTTGAIEDTKMTVSLKPHLTQMWQLLASLHYEANNLNDAVEALRSAQKNEPENPDFMVQLGELLRQDNKASEAINILEQATKLAPKDAKAWTNLGAAFQQEKRVADAKIAYEKALALNPVSAAIASNLGAMAKEAEEWDTALEYFGKAVEIEPNLAEAIVNLGIAIKNVKFNSSNPKLYLPLTKLLTAENFTRPQNVAKSILSLLKQDTQIKDLLLKKNSAVSLNEATFIIKSLDKLPLLHHLMRLCPLPELQFEELFVAMRSLLLKNLGKMEVSPELIYFLSTLSIHCFTNEYVYFENDEETHLIGELQAEISQTLVQSEQPEVIKVLCLASYRPLHQYDWCQKLESLDNLEEVKKRLIEEPLLEKMIAKDIPVLEEISDDVSLKVREQYEENPYPRWVKLGVSIKAKPIVAVCDELKLQLYSENIKNVTAPAILIAGCGTGQHSIGTASRFSNCHVTAVDLSLASLAYAQRKSNELCSTNIDYLHADILHLHQMGKEFDIIESSGVLHHMDEPMAGWRVLVNLLKPGGLMKIGLYSELARHHIVEIRKEITTLGVGTSEADIRKFRQSLAESHNENHQRLTTSGDFFSLSTMRDLIFHVQEHRFTLPKIKNCLDELGLKFCGFEDVNIVSRFKEFHGEEVDIYDLVLWHQYEERNPRAFSGMYQFWCQKP
jgi:tetratricopeptide (TPR) repeat protein/SAM-dependent methyltransferase